MKNNINNVISILLISIFSFFFCLFIYLSMYNKCYLIEYEILLFNSVNIGMYFLLDWMSSSFVSFVVLISFSIVLYSTSYMSGDKNNSLFILLIFMFVGSMLLLILSPNLISILLGWDGLGLISYCLVIYYQSVKSYNAGMLTAMTNRIGDVLILMSIAWMLNYGGWIYTLYFNCDSTINYVIGGLILTAAITKSAQIPFSSWLPAAMAAPTPVSALVHSSTLVTAGVYLLIRFSPIFYFENLKEVLFVLSVMTMFMSGVGAVFEYDLKKIIALSTLSQLGLMISTLTMGLKEVAFFHLITHALFKSLLFMCAGYIIHGMNDSQDIRFMGCLIKQSPLLSMYFNLSNLSLCGMPFLAGFYSKDYILEMILMNNYNLFIFFIYFVATFFTVVYTFRLIYFSMIDYFKLSSYHCFSDNDYMMLKFMMIIASMVIFGGCLLSWLSYFDFSTIILSGFDKMIIPLICFLGGVIGYMLGYSSLLGFKGFSIPLKSFLGEMWFLPYISTHILLKFSLGVGYKYYKIIDSGWGELLGGQGLYKVLLITNKNLNLIQLKNLFILIFIYLTILILLVL
uniref:NADH-ubiquinone oxidoreductase chain 5 n=1 Tax=Kaestneriella sp. KaspPE TaxID=2597008 RepID=A0A8K1ZFQ3_9NEOP|nr:NADH dehydrogenase subunit 5 [Kaestneriella sp. KaspPE]